MFHIHHLRKFTSLRGPQSTRQSSLLRRICTSDSKSTTTVYRGTLFEQRSLALLEQHLSMTLTRVGGKEDGGIDLIGWWWIPEDSEKSRAVDFSKRKRIRVVAQCKAEKKKIGPGYVRELEGVVYRNMDTFLLDKHRDLLGLSSIEGQKQQIPAAAVFLSESPYTKSALLRAMSSPVPFLLIHVPPLPEGHVDAVEGAGEISLGSAVWNAALGGSSGLLQGKMEIRWTRNNRAETSGIPTIWYNGQLVPKWTCASHNTVLAVNGVSVS